MAVCCDPDSKKKHPTFPNCTCNPENFDKVFVCTPVFAYSCLGANKTTCGMPKCNCGRGHGPYTPPPPAAAASATRAGAGAGAGGSESTVRGCDQAAIVPGDSSTWPQQPSVPFPHA